MALGGSLGKVTVRPQLKVDRLVAAAVRAHAAATARSRARHSGEKCAEAIRLVLGRSQIRKIPVCEPVHTCFLSV